MTRIIIKYDVESSLTTHFIKAPKPLNTLGGRGCNYTQKNPPSCAPVVVKAKYTDP